MASRYLVDALEVVVHVVSLLLATHLEYITPGLVAKHDPFNQVSCVIMYLADAARITHGQRPQAVMRSYSPASGLDLHARTLLPLEEKEATVPALNPSCCLALLDLGRLSDQLTSQRLQWHHARLLL